MIQEVCIVMIALSVLATCMHIPRIIDNPYFSFKSHYLYTQSNAIKNSKQEYIEDGVGGSVSFNGDGNVTQSRTIHFDGHDVIVELGGGRLVEK